MTAAGQLARSSEFRFDILHTEYQHDYITVKRGHGRYSDQWAIAAGESEYGRFWTGSSWSFNVRGADAYFWDLETALTTAKDLALVANREIIGILERKFPGEFRGGPHDMSKEVS